MANIINADNGVVSGVAGIKTSADTSGELNIQTNGVTAISISSSQVVTFPSTTSVGTVNFGDGTATFPSIAHAGDTNTGIYFPGTDQVAITTAGTQRVLVDASGNVGIGTSSPAGVLEVATNASGDALVTSYNSVSAGTTAAFTVRRARGTAGSPSAVLLSDALGGLYARGYKATAFSGNVGVIRFEAAENWTDTANGTYITFAATPIGSTSRTEYMRIDPSGNLGLGVTPSAWALSGLAAMQIKNAGFAGYLNNSYVQANAYFDGSGVARYIANGFATQYVQTSGQHIFYTAASGTAGNTLSSNTQAMTLDASGNLIVGGTTPLVTAANRGNITINGSSSSLVALGVSNTATASFYADATVVNLSARTNIPLLLSTNDTERARITSGGDLGVGLTAPVSTTVTAGSITANGVLAVKSYLSSHQSDIGIIEYNSGKMTLRPYGATAGTGYIAFNTGGGGGSGDTERARITSGGQITVNTTTAAAGVGTSVLTLKAVGVGATFGVGPTSDFGNFYVVNTSGVGVYLTDGGTSWTGTSDERHKTDLVNIENAAEKVSTLRAVTGRFNNDDESVSRAFLIAQDVEKVFPQAVDKSRDDCWGLSYTDTIPLLVAAIKELKAELDAAKVKIAALESK